MQGTGRVVGENRKRLYQIGTCSDLKISHIVKMLFFLVYLIKAGTKSVKYVQMCVVFVERRFRVYRSPGLQRFWSLLPALYGRVNGSMGSASGVRMVQ